MKTQSISRKPSSRKAHFRVRPMAPSRGYLESYCAQPEEMPGIRFDLNDWERLAGFMTEKRLAMGCDDNDAPLDAYLEVTSIARFTQCINHPIYLRYLVVDPSCPDKLLTKLYLNQAFCEKVREVMRTGRLRRYDRDLASAMTRLTRSFKFGGGLLGVLHNE